MADVRKYLQAIIQNNRIVGRFINLFVDYLRNILIRFQFKRPKQYPNWEDNRVSKSELESISIIDNTTLLLSDKNIHRGDRRIPGCKEAKKEPSKPACANTKEEGRVMPTQTLPAQNYIYFSYNFQRRFLGVNLIKFYVESQFPIDTYVVDQAGLQNFQSGLNFTTYGGLINATEHKQDVRGLHEGAWYLIINNKGHQPTAVHYEVS